MGIFTIDGISYDGIGVESLTRSASIRDGGNAGTMLSGAYTRDLMGTFYDYSLTITGIEPGSTAYDDLYQALTAPVNSHTVAMPYGQTTIVFEAYIDNVEDALLAMSDTENWWGNLTIRFRAKRPKRLPE